MVLGQVSPLWLAERVQYLRLVQEARAQPSLAGLPVAAPVATEALGARVALQAQMEIN